MSKKSSDFNAQGAIETLLDLKFPVTVEWGTGQMDLRQLQNLPPDEVIPLHEDLSQPVVMKVQGKPVAKGELNRRKGRLFVRITQVLDASLSTSLEGAS